MKNSNSICMKSEQQIQSECVTWLWNTHPETRGLFFAVNNNSEHAVRALQRRAVGLVPGVSDTILLWKGKAYLIEFKTDTGRQSKAQKVWEEKVVGEGFGYFVVRGLGEFKMLIGGII